ncbi:MAG: hypothetical protein JJT78_09750 [Leptospira sp.]|nr:hypothetical protein [Leptospira sp.]
MSAIFTLTLSSENRAISPNPIPNFELKDQFGSKVSSRDLKGKKAIYAGCYPEDEEVCRKIARKIYWKMQSLVYGKEKEYFFLGYVLLNKSNPLLAESLIPKYKSSGYESVYLDWKGKLEKGAQKGSVHIRAVNTEGGIILEEHWKKADNKDVVDLYKRLQN